ncbi:MAG: phosphoribosylformylglycinamidine synthase subunit PurS [Endomicrobium sp.]|jgi:phosphoribosylformylglycinamidine synthase|nr:phosphoribosylformylglycinamidine synthase subunit PurS [Endomicrobium sp.]
MFKIEILTKKGFKNSHGKHVLSDITGIGIRNVIKVEYSPLYIIDGDINFVEAKMIASELLSDKIIETYTVNNHSEHDSKSTATFNCALFVVEVWYKTGVTDTVSESVMKAVKDLGIIKEMKVKMGHKYYLYGKISQTVLNNIATKLLANTLIQEYKIK